MSAHYVRPNISRNARDRTAAFFKVQLIEFSLQLLPEGL